MKMVINNIWRGRFFLSVVTPGKDTTKKHILLYRIIKSLQKDERLIVDFY